MKATLHLLTAYALLSVVLGVVWLVTSYPARPQSWMGWLACFALVLPATLAGEFLGEQLNRNRLALAVERRTQGRRFSWLRMAYLLAVGLLAIGATAGVHLLLQQAG